MNTETLSLKLLSLAYPVQSILSTYGKYLKEPFLARRIWEDIGNSCSKLLATLFQILLFFWQTNLNNVNFCVISQTIAVQSSLPTAKLFCGKIRERCLMQWLQLSNYKPSELDIPIRTICSPWNSPLECQGEQQRVIQRKGNYLS